jgi:hypothetical protein
MSQSNASNLAFSPIPYTVFSIWVSGKSILIVAPGRNIGVTLDF